MGENQWRAIAMRLIVDVVAFAAEVRHISYFVTSLFSSVYFLTSGPGTQDVAWTQPSEPMLDSLSRMAGRD